MSRPRIKGTLDNGKCSNCGYRIVRPFGQEPSITIYYKMYILRDRNKIWGMCAKCNNEFNLPTNFMTFKYVIKKISRGEHDNNKSS